MKRSEAFAIFLENREVITLLAPFWEGDYTIILNRDKKSGNVVFWVTIHKVHVDKSEWNASASGSTILEAAKKAVADAESRIRSRSPEHLAKEKRKVKVFKEIFTDPAFTTASSHHTIRRGK